MKKIYSKFVKDRRKEFQIETALWDDNGTRYVSKRGLYEEGKEHIERVLETYQLYDKSGLVCGAKKQGDEVEFDYVCGETFEEKLLAALGKQDKAGVESLICEYNNIVDKVCLVGEEGIVQNTEMSKNVLGEQIAGVKGYSNVIFDLTFDNLIFDGQDYKIIDYEWRFGFCIEKEFIKFRAVYAFIMKFCGYVKAVFETDDFYGLFGISAENVNRYLAYNTSFVSYVYEENGYNAILKNYEKISVDMFGEQTGVGFKVLQMKKAENSKTYEDLFFEKMMGVIEKNKDYYDDYTKFYRVTEKIRKLRPNGYTDTREFVEEFSAYIDDLYGLVGFYKGILEQNKKRRGVRSIVRKLTRRG